jgi:DNA-binding IclR family transcriptional regulator
MHLTANTTLALSPTPKALNPAAKQQQQQQLQGSKGNTPRAAGAFLARLSSEGEGLIPVGHYDGSAAAAAAAADAGGVFHAAGVGVAIGSRPLLDVGFENLSMTLKSCGKQVLQGITGASVCKPKQQEGGG